MKVRRTAPIAALAAGALVLAACGGGGDDSTDSGPSKLNFYTDKASWEPQFKEVFDFAKEPTKSEITFTGNADAEQYAAAIRQSFRTDKKPDLFTWHTGTELEDLVGQDLIAPTTEIWDEAVENGDVPEELREYFTVDDVQYCVPLLSNYWVMYYNTKVFEENDIKPPESWDDLIGAADKLKAAGVTPFYQTNVLFSFVWFQTLLAGTDPDLYNALSTGEAKYTDQGVVDVMNQWKDMIDKGYFVDAGVETTPEQQLKNGDVAMINFGTFLSGQLNTVGMKAGTDYDFFVVPNVNPDLDQTVLPFETGPLCTASNSSNVDAALDFEKWWVTEDAQTEWSNARGDVSFNPKAEINDESLADLTEDAGGDDVQLVNRYFEATPLPVLTAALDGFGAFVSNPGDPKPILENIQSEADAYWAEQG